MGIRTTHAKGAHPCKTLALPGGPGRPFRWHNYWQFIPGNLRIRLLKMQVSWNLFVLESQYHFHQTSYPSRCVRMANVRFHRTDDQGTVWGASFTQHGS